MEHRVFNGIVATFAALALASLSKYGWVNTVLGINANDIIPLAADNQANNQGGNPPAGRTTGSTPTSPPHGGTGNQHPSTLAHNQAGQTVNTNQNPRTQSQSRRSRRNPQSSYGDLEFTPRGNQTQSQSGRSHRNPHSHRVIELTEFTLLEEEKEVEASVSKESAKETTKMDADEAPAEAAAPLNSNDADVNIQAANANASTNENIQPVCKKFMQDPMEIYVDDEAKLTLHGLVQHYINLQESDKTLKLKDLLHALDSNQVIIFVKSVSRSAELNKLLVECNFPPICIHSEISQEERLKRYKGFKEGKQKILVATDLVGRGIDIERVNIVINYDMPDSADTYLHRVGRAGRFGTKGLAITFVSSASDSEVLNQVQSRFEVDIKELPEQIDTSTYMPN